ncbi:hypothetical protein K443DRAFT_6819 [Laccaria amethystina LaAM-08-1]|uniref:Uncharacterized protein n=1 Tax=Laccaria amethystina LaAM-08-1 TaxID=1095629 RepID=A0A0C9WS46_9AGAR|nr:hypothetical protein K443DRAFT_6819 [Laccaria amethystina LaAM-08-1]
MGFERQRASDSDGFRWEMTRMAMESHHRVANDITPSQIFSSWGGFTMRADWLSSKNCETTFKFSPSSSPRSMLKSNWSTSTIAQSGAEDDFNGPADIYVPTEGCRSLKLSKSHLSSLSCDNRRQPISPSPPTHAASPAMSYKRSPTLVFGS